MGRWVPDDCFHHYRSYLQVGDLHVVHVSAPGIGHRSYRITAIDETGIYGALVEDTVRILTPGEVI